MSAKSGVTGGAELQLRLAALPGNMAQNVLRKAIRQGANMIAEKARANFVNAASPSAQIDPTQPTHKA